MNEIWKDIPDYETLYSISNLGNIRSNKKFRWNRYKNVIKNERILTPMKTKDGYLSISLYKKRKRKDFRVHRLVLLAFKGKSDLQCNHINGIKSDNRLENLEYCTASQNMKHAYKKGLYPNHGQWFNKKIICNENKEVYKSLHDASRKLNISVSSICQNLKGTYKKAGGKTFNYV